MAALRWILLLVGLAFLGLLAAWEMRRPRQGRRASEHHGERSEPAIGTLGADSPGAAPRSRAQSPPLIDLSALEPTTDETGPDQPMYADAHDDVAPVTRRELADTAGPQSEEGFDAPAPPSFQPESVSVTEQPLPGEHDTPLVVEWPPEHERHVIALRIVALGEERLSGRALRQALAACGFVHGRFGIYHQPGSDGRALLSAASLSKPGVFDPATMDFNRFAGLSLFAVVPGPLSANDALAHLLDYAHDLAQRLRARVQDEHGLALDAPRLESLRHAVQALPQAVLREEPAA